MEKVQYEEVNMDEFGMDFDSGLQIPEEKPIVPSEGTVTEKQPNFTQFTISDNIEVVFKTFTNLNAMIYISQIAADGS